MPPVRVLVVVTPHAYATALAAGLAGADDDLDVAVTDVMAGEQPDVGRVDVVVTNLPLADATTAVPVTIELPESPEEPFLVRGRDLTLAVPWRLGTLFDDVCDLVRRATSLDGERRLDGRPART